MASPIAELGLPGASLLGLAGAPAQDRAALSELHTYCPGGVFMLRTLRHKYIHYVGAPPQLFDLEADPKGLHDLAGDPAHAALLREMEGRLRAMLDPETVDADAVAGTVDAVVSDLPPLLAQAREGRLRILAVSIPRRSGALSDVPTLAEAGFPGFDMSNTVGLVTRRGTPPGIVTALNAANQAIDDPELRRLFLANGAEPVGSSAERYTAFVEAERNRLREVVQATRITVE